MCFHMCAQFPAGFTTGSILKCVKWRKWKMWERLLHPIPTSKTASLSQLDGNTEASTCAATGTAEPDDHYERLPLYRPWCQFTRWDTQYCIFTLWWVAAVHAHIPGVPMPILPSDESEWREGDVRLLMRDYEVPQALGDLMMDDLDCGIALDSEAVNRAVAQFDAWEASDAARADVEYPDVKPLIRVVRAAQREGQGVIVYPGRAYDDE